MTFDRFLAALEKLLFAIGFCSHKWKIHDTISISDIDSRLMVITNDPTKWGVRVGTRYHLRCEKCGQMKSIYMGN